MGPPSGKTSDFIFHVFYPVPDTGYVWGAGGHTFFFLHLSGEAASEVCGTQAGFVGLQPDHQCGAQLGTGNVATGLLHFTTWMESQSPLN